MISLHYLYFHFATLVGAGSSSRFISLANASFAFLLYSANFFPAATFLGSFSLFLVSLFSGLLRYLLCWVGGNLLSIFYFYFSLFRHCYLDATNKFLDLFNTLYQPPSVDCLVFLLQLCWGGACALSCATINWFFS